MERQQNRKKSIQQVKREYEFKLLENYNVVGISTEIREEKEECIVVTVIEGSPHLLNDIPEALDGYKVIIEESGGIELAIQQD